MVGDATRCELIFWKLKRKLRGYAVLNFDVFHTYPFPLSFRGEKLRIDARTDILFARKPNAIKAAVFISREEKENNKGTAVFNERLAGRKLQPFPVYASAKQDVQIASPETTRGRPCFSLPSSPFIILYTDNHISSNSSSLSLLYNVALFLLQCPIKQKDAIHLERKNRIQTN